MLSSVLHSPRAIQVNVEIMRTFVRLRRLLASHADLAARLEALEQKYDGQFRVVFDAIRQMMKGKTVPGRGSRVPGQKADKRSRVAGPGSRVEKAVS
jgi:hypothetical protein